jgi:hypothetical protein
MSSALVLHHKNTSPLLSSFFFCSVSNVTAAVGRSTEADDIALAFLTPRSVVVPSQLLAHLHVSESEKPKQRVLPSVVDLCDKTTGEQVKIKTKMLSLCERKSLRQRTHLFFLSSHFPFKNAIQPAIKLLACIGRLFASILHTPRVLYLPCST